MLPPSVLSGSFYDSMTLRFFRYLGVFAMISNSCCKFPIIAKNLNSTLSTPFPLMFSALLYALDKLNRQTSYTKNLSAFLFCGLFIVFAGIRNAQRFQTQTLFAWSLFSSHFLLQRSKALSPRAAFVIFGKSTNFQRNTHQVTTDKQGSDKTSDDAFSVKPA